MARSNDITNIIEIGGYNYIGNPSFEVNTTGWGGTGTGSSITRVTSEHLFGSASGRMDTTDDGQWISYIPLDYTHGAVHAFSVYVKGAVGETIHLNVYTGEVDHAADPVVLTGGWQRLSLAQALDATGSPELQVRRYSGDTTSSIYIDGAMVQRKSSMSTYFDGSFGTGYGWLGTAHDSVSYRKSRQLA